MFSIGLLKNDLFPLDQILNYMFSRGILVRFVFDWQILKHIFPIKLEKTVPQKICFHSVNTKQYVFDYYCKGHYVFIWTIFYPLTKDLINDQKDIIVYLCRY